MVKKHPITIPDFETEMLDEIRSLSPELLTGEIYRMLPPHPDFCIIGSEHSIGIEFTRIYESSTNKIGSRSKQSESIYSSLTMRIKEAYQISNFQTPYITFHWNYDNIPFKQMHNNIIEQTINIIASNIPCREYEHHFINSESFNNEMISDYLHGISIILLPYQTDTWGTAGPVIWVGSGIDELSNCIVQKEEKLSLYKQHCDECWLMIVADGTCLASSIFTISDLIDNIFSSNYDRVLFYNRIEHRVVDLQLLLRQ